MGLDIDKMSLDKMKSERLRVQNERKQSKMYLHALTLGINEIYAEDNALRKLSPDMARALGLSKEKIELVEKLNNERKELAKKGVEDVVIMHKNTITLKAKTVR